MTTPGFSLAQLQMYFLMDKATHKGIREALSEIPKDYERGDFVVLYSVEAFCPSQIRNAHCV